jgi:hypothetical protein
LISCFVKTQFLVRQKTKLEIQIEFAKHRFLLKKRLNKKYRECNNNIYIYSWKRYN